MRIAIDARLNAYRQGGIPQYTRQLMTALAEVSPEDEFISLQHRDQLRPLAIASNVVRRTVLTPPHHRFEQWTLPLEALLARPHVLHCPDFIAPVRRPCPAVVTIHDLAFMHYPDILDTAASAYYGQVARNTPRADAVIAVSEATRQDIAQFLDIPIEQIDVIHEAAAPLYTRLDLRVGEARVLNSTPVEAGTFMLFVSTLEPRKNLPTLLRALRICLDRKPNVDYRLVVVGRRGWRDEEIFTTVRDLKLGANVLFAGGVGQYDLRWLYNACRMYINPSLYEGFGLPLLEAMACGAACLAAATSSLPEIGGNAALYVPPLDASVWADQIEALWDDEERRAELGRLGMARAQRFSWLRAARETLAVYKRAADRVVPSPAPRPAQSQQAFSEQFDSAPGRWAIPAPGAARACLRCGSEMTPGKLQQHLGMVASDQADANQVLLPRLWSCATCGHVELVVDWALAVKDETSGAPLAELVDPYALAAPVDGAEQVLAAHEIASEPIGDGTEPAAAEALVASEPIGQDQSEPEAQASLDSAAAQALAASEPIGQDQSELAAPPVDQTLAPGSSGEQALHELPANAPIIEPGTTAELADTSALASHAPQEPDRLVAPDGVLADLPELSAPANGPATEAPAAPAGQHAAGNGQLITHDALAETRAAAVGGSDDQAAPPNGQLQANHTEPLATKKPRSRRGAPATPATPDTQPAKRRASRSKRK